MLHLGMLVGWHSCRQWLFLGSRCLDHRTDPRFTPLVRQQRANQHFAVDPVSLRTPAPTGCRNLARIHDVAFDPFILQRAIDPESVEASLLNDDEREDLAPALTALSHWSRSIGTGGRHASEPVHGITGMRR